ncbi:hAT family C-terminal dimerization region [Phytophthora infestans]|uniref:HAT family C-terminal dimerization region n=1 Tax=Phytophthora infestans TaxID=4787 RepID=A0A8S9U3F3_PHYIN|nr:hAT family C-terminal dimerization region [Phytophthora infestans]KAF4147139.1 hAT family C-terminal dimerization region [Phytophthora infestans]
MLKLHLIYKNTQESLNRAVTLCYRQHGLKGKEAVSRLSAVNDKVRSNLLYLLKKVAGPLDGVAGHVGASSPQLIRPEARLAPRTRPVVAPRADKRAEDELDCWMVDVERNANMAAKETVLHLWKRLERSGQYRIIPKAVRVLFSIPVSFCQIERYFSVSGEMVSVQRTTCSLSGDTIVMGVFINRNPELVNLLQCEGIPWGQHHFHKPSNLLLDIDPDLYMDVVNPDIIAEFVSSTSVSREFNEEEEKSALGITNAFTRGPNHPGPCCRWEL